MENRDKKEERNTPIFLCPVCLNKQKPAGPSMCERCEGIYEKEVVEAVRNHQQPEEKWAYTLKRAKENLVFCQEELDSKKDSTATYWVEALKEVKAECRGIHLSRDSFLEAVSIRFEEILELAGLEQTAENIKILKNKVRELKKAIRWLEKVIQQRQTKVVTNAETMVTA